MNTSSTPPNDVNILLETINQNNTALRTRLDCLEEQAIEQKRLISEIMVRGTQNEELEELDKQGEKDLHQLQDTLNKGDRQIKKLQDSNNTPLMRLAIFIGKIFALIFIGITQGCKNSCRLLSKPLQYGYSFVVDTKIE